MQENEPRHRNDVEMINCYGLVLLKKGNPQGALKAAARSIELKWDDPQALGDIGRGLAEARAVAEGRPVLGGGSAAEPGKPASAAGPRGDL